METFEIAAALVTVLAMLGSVVFVVRSAINSPRRKALAEAEKQERLKELGLLDGPQIQELRAQIQEKDTRIAELLEERDFLRRLVTERDRGEGKRGGA